MASNFVQNGLLRAAGLATLRTAAAAQVWRTGPRLFVNSIPKAGTHLLAAELARFPGIVNSRAHVHMRDRPAGDAATGDPGIPPIDLAAVDRALRFVRGRQFATGHLYWQAELADFVESRGFRTIFVLRDPRDVVVSRYHYILGLRRHPLHAFLSGLADDAARWRVLIDGHAGTPFLRPLRSMLDGFSGWVGHPGVLTIPFEALVGERGGGSGEAKQEALGRIADFADLPRSGIAEQAQTAGGATATLRKGQANAWRTTMPREIQDMVHARAGDLIARLGYPVPDGTSGEGGDRR